jgi:hypothetical protein
LIQRANRQRNLIVIAPRTGVIGGRRAEWRIEQPAPFVDIVFEPAPAAEAGAQAKTGQVRLGDFAKFCTFLRSMGDR